MSASNDYTDTHHAEAQAAARAGTAQVPQYTSTAAAEARTMALGFRNAWADLRRHGGRVLPDVMHGNLTATHDRSGWTPVSIDHYGQPHQLSSDDYTNAAHVRAWLDYWHTWRTN